MPGQVSSARSRELPPSHACIAYRRAVGVLESESRFFKKGENPNFPPDSPMQPSRASAQILRQYAPLRLLSVGSIASAPRVASAAEMAALILNPARHGAREIEASRASGRIPAVCASSSSGLQLAQSWHANAAASLAASLFGGTIALHVFAGQQLGPSPPSRVRVSECSHPNRRSCGKLQVRVRSFVPFRGRF